MCQRSSAGKEKWGSKKGWTKEDTAPEGYNSLRASIGLSHGGPFTYSKVMGLNWVSKKCPQMVHMAGETASSMELQNLV